MAQPQNGAYGMAKALEIIKDRGTVGG